ncbi:unnamed protein product [Amoebophrya sp. A120]|nr:unnamed protein product [Amoebophrya sp. A120]|eukprot:GSA120T00022886001.1
MTGSSSSDTPARGPPPTDASTAAPPTPAPRQPSLAHTVLASSAAACLGKMATHPLDTLKARMQVDVLLQQNNKNHDTAKPSWRAHFSKGNLYEGFFVAVLGSLPAGALYMTTYEMLRTDPRSPLNYENALFSSTSSTGATSTTSCRSQQITRDFLAGLGAEAISCILWCPVDVVKERLQVQQSLREVEKLRQSTMLPAERPHKNKTFYYNNACDAVRKILQTEGVRGLYRAYGATLAAFGPQTAINLALYEQLEEKALEVYHRSRSTTSTRKTKEEKAASTAREAALSATGEGGRATTNSPSRATGTPPPPPVSKPAFLTFACACVSGSIACFVTTPLDLAKLRMQVDRATAANLQVESSTSTVEQAKRFTSGAREQAGNKAGAARRSATTGTPSSTKLFNYRHLPHALFTIAKTEGFPALFRGATLRCALWVPQTAIFLASFKWLLQFFSGGGIMLNTVSAADEKRTDGIQNQPEKSASRAALGAARLVPVDHDTQSSR